MKRLEIFGDSIMRGVMFSAQSNRYCLCSDNKYSSVEKLGVEVKNNSKMGATIKKGSEILNRRLDSIDSDTIVVFEFGGNDCDYNWQNISDNPDGDFLPNTPEKEFVEDYRTVINECKERGASVAVASLIPIDAEKYMNWITKGRSYENVLRWLGTVGRLASWQEYYNRMVESVAAAFSAPIIDFRKAFTENGNFSDLLCADGIHPTQEGHNIINSTLCRFVQSC